MESLDGTIYLLGTKEPVDLTATTQTLYSLDPATAAMTKITDLNGDLTDGGHELTSLDDTLYTVDGRTIYAIDASTAATTEEMTVPTSVLRSLDCIAAYRGSLWAAGWVPAPGSPGDSAMIRIDDVSTGDASPVEGTQLRRHHVMCAHDGRLWTITEHYLAFLCRAVPW